VLGSSTYSFTVMLATFLIGIAAGSAWAGKKLPPSSCNLVAFAWVQAGVGISTAIMVFLGEYLPVAALVLAPIKGMQNAEYAERFQWLYYMISQLPGILVCFSMMLIPALFLGACFPIAVQIYSRNVDKLGKSIGVVYGSNTAGAIFGSVIGSFILMPTLGLYWTMAVGCIVNLLLAIVLAVGGLMQARPKTEAKPASEGGGLFNGGASEPRPAFGRGYRIAAQSAIGASALFILLFALFERWDPLVMNFGVFQYGGAGYRQLVVEDGIFRLDRGLRKLKVRLNNHYQLLYVRDGINSTVTVMGDPDLAIAALLDRSAEWGEDRMRKIRDVLKSATEVRLERGSTSGSRTSAPPASPASPSRPKATTPGKRNRSSSTATSTKPGPTPSSSASTSSGSAASSPAPETSSPSAATCATTARSTPATRATWPPSSCAPTCPSWPTRSRIRSASSAWAAARPPAPSSSSAIPRRSTSSNWSARCSTPPVPTSRTATATSGATRASACSSRTAATIWRCSTSPTT
jgi:hypothetical protein